MLVLFTLEHKDCTVGSLLVVSLFYSAKMDVGAVVGKALAAGTRRDVHDT